MSHWLRRQKTVLWTLQFRRHICFATKCSAAAVCVCVCVCVCVRARARVCLCLCLCLHAGACVRACLGCVVALQVMHAVIVRHECTQQVNHECTQQQLILSQHTHTYTYHNTHTLTHTLTHTRTTRQVYIFLRLAPSGRNMSRCVHLYTSSCS